MNGESLKVLALKFFWSSNTQTDNNAPARQASNPVRPISEFVSLVSKERKCLQGMNERMNEWETTSACKTCRKSFPLKRNPLDKLTSVWQRFVLLPSELDAMHIIFFSQPTNDRKIERKKHENYFSSLKFLSERSDMMRAY